MEALEKEVILPDWHCYACDARVAQSSIGYSYPTREPQCSCCGRFGFLEPLTTAESVPQTTRTQSENSNGPSSYFTAEISAVALPLELPASRPSTNQDGFRITFDGLDMPLTRESAPNDAVEPSQLTETQIIAFDLSQPRPLQNSTNQSSNALEQQFSDVYNALIEYLEPLDDLTVNTMYHEVFGVDTNSESRGTWLQAVAELPRTILNEPSSGNIMKCFFMPVIECLLYFLLILEGPCAICQEDFKIGDAVTPLCADKQRCAHTFHSSCIIPWLKEVYLIHFSKTI
jgi:hypothetical protein